MKFFSSITFVLVVAATVLLAAPASAQSCAIGDDIDAATRTSLANAAQQYFTQVSRGDSAGLQAQAVPQFTNIAAIVDEHKSNLQGATPNVKSVYLLDSTQSKPGERAEFYCGIFNSPVRVAFSFNDLPPGKYGVVVQNVTGGKVPYTLTWILQQNAAQWKLAGLVAKAAAINGNDYLWYWKQARAYKQQGKKHDAYLYYVIADWLARPLSAMSTPNMDKLADELTQADPGDLATNGPITVPAANGKSFQVTQIFPTPVEDKLYLVVKYSVPDISNTPQVFQDNTAMIKGLLTRFPELREAFGGVVARATAPNGQDYGTLLAMNDVK